MPTEESCGAIVWMMREETPRFLVLRRSDEDNVWEPPKGHRHPEETEKQTAARELKEELNIHSPIFHESFREVLEYTNSKGVIIRYVFFLARADEITLSSEHNAAEWINIEELPKYFKYDDIRAIYRKAEETVSALSANEKILRS